VVVVQLDVDMERQLIWSDPLRLIEAVITSVSLLGVGTIIRHRGSGYVERLTTAASVFFATAMPMAVALSQSLRGYASREDCSRMTEEMTDETRQDILRQRLEESLRASRQELEEIEERLQDKGDYSPGTGDPLVVRWELDLALKTRVENRIEELQEALDRLDEGTYGICRRCGRHIDIERLEALPQTDICINCARELEEAAA
jgi:RNA polymerase-binding protein DksA